MKKYSTIALGIIFIMLILSTITFAWFTYVQRKAVTTLFSHEIAATVSLNDQVFNRSTTISNLAFIDFEQDLILDKNLSFNDIALEMDIKLTLDQNSPLSRFSFDVVVNQKEIIYVIILDDQIEDYHLFMSQFVIENETKNDVINRISVFNQNQLDLIGEKIIFPNETIAFKLVLWADYYSLDYPELYKSFDGQLAIHLKILSAYSDVS